MTNQSRLADAIAERASRDLASRWSGAAHATDWIDAYWSAAAIPEPDDPPQAVTLLGSLPAIRWYRRGRDLVGYAHARHDGCYVVPETAALRGMPHPAPA